ncbi:MAG: hypothetical protein AB1756_09940 [Acidobacteriota bacterium]
MSYTFLFWGYNIIWILMAAYLTFILVRLDRVEKDLNRMEEKLDRQKNQ